MARASTQLALDLAWSLWAELGVPSPLRRHGDWLVVPEPLLLFTSTLAEEDRRLRDNAIAWCREHKAVLSARALRHAYERDGWGVAVDGNFAATLRDAGLRWPGAAVGSAVVVAAEIKGPSAFVHPSQLALRLRALLGVGSRAEVLRVLLVAAQPTYTASELADAAYATKRQVNETVEHLRLAGLVEVDRHRQPYKVRLRERDAVIGLVGSPPPVAPDLGALLWLLHGIRTALARVERPVDTTAGAQLHRFLRQHEGHARRLGLRLPEGGPAYGERAYRWCAVVLEQAAQGLPVTGE
ncbi:MAG: hypothetical protein ACR2KP_19450 [Egibacteraceae bacterium]